MSKSKDKSIRLYNGRGHYNEWVFVYQPQQQAPGGGAPSTSVPGVNSRGTGPGGGLTGPRGNGPGTPRGNGPGGFQRGGSGFPGGPGFPTGASPIMPTTPTSPPAGGGRGRG